MESQQRRRIRAAPARELPQRVGRIGPSGRMQRQALASGPHPSPRWDDRRLPKPYCGALGQLLARAGSGQVAQPGGSHPETLPHCSAAHLCPVWDTPKLPPSSGLPISNSAVRSRNQTLGQITHLGIIIVIPATLSLPISLSSLANALFLVTLF